MAPTAPGRALPRLIPTLQEMSATAPAEAQTWDFNTSHVCLLHDVVVFICASVWIFALKFYFIQIQESRTLNSHGNNLNILTALIVLGESNLCRTREARWHFLSFLLLPSDVLGGVKMVLGSLTVSCSVEEVWASGADKSFHPVAFNLCASWFPKTNPALCSTTQRAAWLITNREQLRWLCLSETKHIVTAAAGCVHPTKCHSCLV